MKEKAPDFSSVPCSRFDRRGFLRLAAGSLFATPLSVISPNLTLPAQVRPKAIAFDALAIFDPRSILKSTSQLFPKEGAELSREWRVSQFEYTWLRNSMNRYTNFWQVTHEALTNAANKVNVHLTEVHQSQLMEKFRQLEPWPDAGPVLLQLRNAGIRVCILSDFTESMLRSCVEHAGLNGIFEHLLSCDRVREFKPSPRAYQMGVGIRAQRLGGGRLFRPSRTQESVSDPERWRCRRIDLLHIAFPCCWWCWCMGRGQFLDKYLFRSRWLMLE